MILMLFVQIQSISQKFNSCVTDRPTYTTSYRDARTQLKRQKKKKKMNEKPTYLQGSPMDSIGGVLLIIYVGGTRTIAKRYRDGVHR